MDETTSPGAPQSGEGREPGGTEVLCALDGHTARLTVTGELTDAARRPLVRALTDLLLSEPALHRVEINLRDVSFMNSAGMAVLVQAQRMTAPRGVDVVLVDAPLEVIRPLQLSGLWHRFPVVESAPRDQTDGGS
ncbi:MAG: STAS domain-containing protein [Blastococcus sp.]